jgi:prepilin-type N-terminal cleavage/methylation domain-containing protein
MNPSAPNRLRSAARLGAGFTLIEMMIVVGIMCIIMTMGAPVMYRLWHKAPMIRAVRETQEVLQNARARAILQGHTTEVVFHPQSRTFEVSGAAAAAAPQRRVESDDLGALEPAPAAPPHSGLSGQWDESILIEMLDVNLTEYKDTEVAHVKFYPNGTCDELTIVLHSTRNEWYKITTEVTTGLSTVGPVDQ